MRKLMFGFVTAAAVVAATPLLAQEKAEGRRGAGEGRELNLKALIKSADTNDDGKLSAAEAPGRLKENFERFDADKDGFVNEDELAKGFRGGAAGRGPADPKAAEALFDRQDANSDGKLTKDELPEDRRPMFQQMLDRLDDDGDGALTKEQFIRVMARMAQARRPDGAPDRRPEGRPEGRPGPGMPLIRALDANADGEVSADEIKNASAALAKLDKNDDGKLTREEFAPPFPPGRPGEGRPGDRRGPEGRRPEGDRRPDGDRPEGRRREGDRRLEGEKPVPPKND